MASADVPTHLDVEDTVVLGLTLRQMLLLLVGSGAAYTLWVHLLHAGVPLALGVLVTGCVLAPTIALAFLQPEGLLLDHWLLIRVRYACLPRTLVWGCVPLEDSPRERMVPVWSRFNRPGSRLTALRTP